MSYLNLFSSFDEEVAQHAPRRDLRRDVLHQSVTSARTRGVETNIVNNNKDKENDGESNNSENQAINNGPSGSVQQLCLVVLTLVSFLLFALTLPLSLCVCLRVTQEYERAVIFRLGRLQGSKGPGIIFLLPCIETCHIIDLRTITLSVPPQEVLTRDSVTVSVDAVVYFRVDNATVSVSNVEDAHHSTQLLAQTTLRNILGTRCLHQILADRESIANAMQLVLDEATGAWGIKVERVEIKDARLPVLLQRVMAAEAEAAREARAKVIAAEGEQRASKALKVAANVIAESPGAMQLRYLQTLSSISAEKNSTIIFPLPIDLFAHFLGSKMDSNGFNNKHTNEVSKNISDNEDNNDASGSKMSIIGKSRSIKTSNNNRVSGPTRSCSSSPLIRA